MRTYRVKVSQGEDGWLVAEGVNLRGLVTQGRDLNELVLMIQDAIALLTDSSAFSLHLQMPADIELSATRAKKSNARKRRKKAA